ncbi:unnamed protein product [Polarella glacialis]|uniref:DUF1311 domain-containing protein n=2 Tax=Polarella glacialis TaxID=89957 RepID=A0A813ECX7_POLGL|nr:unnamed protein product [Polarella glacialis]
MSGLLQRALLVVSLAYVPTMLSGQEVKEPTCAKLKALLAGERKAWATQQSWYQALGQKCEIKMAEGELEGLTPFKLAVKCTWLGEMEHKGEAKAFEKFYWYPSLREACGKAAFEEKLEHLSPEGLARRCAFIDQAIQAGDSAKLKMQSWYQALQEECAKKALEVNRTIRKLSVAEREDWPAMPQEMAAPVM